MRVLTKFKEDMSRNLKVVDVNFYQMDLAPLVDSTICDPENGIGQAGEDGKFLPSWTKFAKAPVRAKGFFFKMLQAVFLGTNSDSLNADWQFDASGLQQPEQRVAMMWMSGATTNKNLKVIGEIANNALPAFEVIVISGAEVIGGQKVNNRNSELIVKEVIEKAIDNGNKPVLIIAANMAQRSFSISEITELYLCYDSGSEGATIQKMSRALTPSSRDNKVSRIVSLSFDPGRDDKFDALIVQSAANYLEKNKDSGIVVDMVQSLRLVLKTINIFSCTDQEPIRFNIDDYLASIMERQSLTRIIGKVSNLSLLNDEEIAALAEGNAEYFKSQKPDAVKKGKTTDEPRKKSVSKEKTINELTESQKAKLMAKARAVIVAIVENIDIFINGTNSDNLEEAFNKIDNCEYSKDLLSKKFEVEYDIIKFLFVRGVINRNLIDLRMGMK